MTQEPKPSAIEVSANGKSNPALPSKQKSSFDQPLTLRQSPKWAITLLWLILGLVTVGTIWACVAKIDEAVPAQGKLEPQTAVKDVQAPIGGVVKEVLVTEGQRVKAGEVLIRFDPTNIESQLKAFKKVRDNLLQENNFYRGVLSGKTTVNDFIATGGVVPSEYLSLARNRELLIAETQMYRAQLSGGGNVRGEELERLQANRAELASRSLAAEASMAQQVEQLSQIGTRRRNRQETLAINENILRELDIVAKEGAVSRNQYLKQLEDVQNARSELRQLELEEIRLRAAITESRAKLQNTFDSTRKESTTQLAESNRRISEIDTQFSKAIVENTKRLAELEGQITQAENNLKYQELRAPVAGTVFELKAKGIGFVANTSEPVLKIVPDDEPLAKAYITNQDIGFVREDMDVDVRIDSFPFSEYGDIKGKLVWIGSDALPPEQNIPYFRFPAKIKMNRQTISFKDRNNSSREIRLQSGMSLTANIRVRERTVMSIFIDSFTRGTESLKFVR